MRDLIIAFAQNLVLPLALVFCYTALLRYGGSARTVGFRLVGGLIFAGGSLLSMLMTLPIAEGVSIDNRIAPVLLSGLFLGGPGTAVTVTLTVAFRLWLGGSGAVAGSAALLCAGILGWLVGRTRRNLSVEPGADLCVLTGLGAVAVTLPWTLILPARGWEIFSIIALPVLVMYPFATGVLGWLLGMAEQHQRLLRELAQRDRRFGALVEGSPEAILLADPATGQVLDANPKACELIGRSRDELIGLHQRQLHPAHVDDRHHQDFREHVGETAGGGAGHPIRTAFLRPDGEQVPVEAVACTIEIEGRSALVGFFRDLRERDQTEQALADARRLMGLIVEAADAIIVGLDRSGRVVFANAACERISGHPVDALKGRTWFPLVIPPERYPDFNARIGTGQSTGQLALDHPLVRRDGSERLVAWRIHRFDDPRAEVHRVVIGVDLSDRAEKEAQLRQGEKMQAVGQLAGGVAHDFNNQLQVIDGQTRLIARHGPPEVQAAAAAILASVGHAADLTAKLLAFSRRGALRQEPIDLADLAEEVVVLLRGTLDRRITVELVLNQFVAWVEGDRSSLENVLLNLALNARDAMSAGGVITITIDRAESLPEQGLVGGFEGGPGPWIVLTVADTGSGIPPEVLPRIFEPFFTTKGQGKGTGLGLSAVFGTIQQHHGMIRVQSIPDQGTAITLYLPKRIEGGTGRFTSRPIKALRDPAAAAAPAASATPAAAAAEAPATPSTTEPTPVIGVASTIPGRRILLVDDEPVILELTTLELQDADCSVQAFADGREALAWAQANPDGFDALVTDLNMPGMSGEDLVWEILLLRPTLRIVLATGMGPTDISPDLRRQPGLAVLVKPFGGQELISLLVAKDQG